MRDIQPRMGSRAASLAAQPRRFRHGHPRALRLLAAACATLPAAASAQDGPASRAASAPGGATIRYFKDPAADLKPEPESELLVLARALRAATQHDPDEADRILAPRRGANADALRAIVATERALLGKLAEEVAAGRKPTLALPDPGKPKESALFQVVQYAAGARELEVERKPKRIKVAASTVPPHILGESLARLKLPILDQAKPALGLLVAAWACGRADEKAVLARAKGLGFVPENPLHPEVAGQLRMLGSFDSALAAFGDPAIGPAKALASFEASLGPSPTVRASARTLLRNRWKDLWQTNAFLGEALKGTVSVLKDGRVRIEYLFDREAELEDWPRLDARAEDFHLLHYRGEKASPKVADGVLDMQGSVVFRHLLQFTGDIELEVRPGLYKEAGKGDETLIPGHPAAGILARPGGFAFLMRPNGVLERTRNGSSTSDDTAVAKHWPAVSKEIMEGSGLRLVGTSDQVRVCGKSTDYVSMPLAADVERKGAVVLASSADPTMYRPLLDRVVIIGTPDPDSLGALGSRWAEKIVKRL